MENKIKDFLRKQGAELVGIAAVENIPEYHPPRSADDIIPGARSVVVMGIPMLRGAVASQSSRVSTVHSKGMFEELNRLAYEAGRYLERLGHVAAPVAPQIPIEMSRETRGFSGDLSLKHMAVAAGLGSLGKSRLVITPEFGPRVYFGAVVTDAPLTGDRPLRESLCAEGCSSCVDNCPNGALKAPYDVDINKCYSAVQPYGLGNFIRYLSAIDPADKDGWKKAFRDPLFWNYYQAGGLGLYYDCYQCLLNCPVGR